jgi:tetratricopeptide (TPR) repeat protein
MSFRFSSCASAFALALLFLPACTQVRGRKRIREANELYHRGKYAEAVKLYQEAESMVPELPALWLNEGYTCRQLIAPGGHDPESRRAAACALAAFHRLGEVAPNDPRAGELIVQTWFDVQDYPSLEAAFLERRRQAPDDLDAVHGLQDVYLKWGKWPQALEWSKQAAALRPNDAEAQYGVGTFVWQILSSHGGGAPMAGYSPWPEVSGASASMTVAPPATRPGDITAEARVALADQGIAYLEKALQRRPHYPEAMTYLALLWRQKSFAFFTDPIAWQGAVDEADNWQQRAALCHGDPQRVPDPPHEGLRQAELGSVHANAGKL